MKAQGILRYRQLPIFWQLLAPFLALMLSVGALGVFVIVRHLSTGADTALAQDLARRSLDAQALLRERELYLLESANLAANLEGIARAVDRRDRPAVASLLESVAALKGELAIVAAADRSGAGLVDITRTQPDALVTVGSGFDWGRYDAVRTAVTGAGGVTAAELILVGDRHLLAIAAPVCRPDTPSCEPLGVVIVGLATPDLVNSATAQERPGESPATPIRTAVALYSPDGALLGASGRTFDRSVAPTAGATRRTHQVGSSEWTTAYLPYDVQGSRVGTLAVSIPTDPSRAGVRGAAIRLGLVVLAAAAGAVAIGALLSRRVVAQIRAMVHTNRALGRGDLSARAPVDGPGELAELAEGVNQMADQLQASYETLELRVAQRTEEIQRLLRERSEFFAAMSHELRTPLAVVLSEARMIEDPTYRKSAAWARRAAATLNLSAQQVLSVVDDILELAKAEAGRTEINIADTDVDRVLSELRPTIEGLARAAQLEVRLDVPPRTPPVRADARRLRDVVINLVDNAVKYTPPGGVVAVNVAAANGHVSIAVEDTGVGIPAQAGERLFEPFYRVEGSATHQGQPSTGLGLAIAKRLVEAQGGQLSYISELGRGSTFTVTLNAGDADKRKAQE